MKPADLDYLKKSLPLGGADAGAYRLPGPGRRLALAAGYVTKSIDRARMTVQSVLTYPGRDYDDDTVNPAGGDWTSEFPRNPVVNWTHREPVGRGDVPELRAFDGGHLPVGTTHFFQSAADLKGLRLVSRDARGEPTVTHTPRECLEAAESAFRLVADDVASGVSIEFRGTEFWPTGRKSLTLGRDAIHWEKWTGYGWAHALQCVNPNARTILPPDPARLEKAYRIAETGRFPGGQRVSPLVLKAFLPLKGRKPQFVRVENKAMPTDDDKDYEDDAPEGVDTLDPETGELAPGDAPAPAGDAPAPDEAPDAGGPLKPTPKLVMTAMQHFKDGVSMVREAIDGDTVEHEGGIDLLLDYADKIDALLDKMNAEAAKEFPNAGFGSATKPPAEDSGAVETNGDGAITNKAFPDGFPVRFRMDGRGGFARVEPPAPDRRAAGDPDPTQLKAMADRVERLEREARRERREAEREARIKARNEARARP